jgi:hypothetical protein
VKKATIKIYTAEFAVPDRAVEIMIYYPQKHFLLVAEEGKLNLVLYSGFLT